MALITAKFKGTCRYCGGSVAAGTNVGWAKGKGIWHQGCAPLAADREYMAGVADGNRYLAEKAVYGDALAERFAAEDEFNRYWKYGEDY